MTLYQDPPKSGAQLHPNLSFLTSPTRLALLKVALKSRLKKSLLKLQHLTIYKARRYNIQRGPKVSTHTLALIAQSLNARSK